MKPIYARALLMGYPLACFCQTPTFSNSTSTTNSSAVMTAMSFTIEDLWDLWIGPVQTVEVTTTVSPTPVASNELIPPPPMHYPARLASMPQVPAMAKNTSWSFPKDFWWGVSSAAYQVEGAVKDEGRGPSVWDRFTHNVVGYTLSNDTGDIADNHYYLYKQDIARIAALGIKVYSFSISWSRIFPFGRGVVNEAGLAHYEDVINTCIEYGVQPAVTLFHWDTPLYLQNLYGGWSSEKIVDDFVNYADVVFRRYGNKVSMWFTLNEPIVFCGQLATPHYFTEIDIPKAQQPYYCGQNALLAHAKAYHLGKSLNLTGIISFKNNGGYKIPHTNSSADAIAVQRAWDFNEGWFANPVFIDGDYPKYLKEYTSTFLRPFTTEEKMLINGTGDIFAHDAYTSQFCAAPDSGIEACVSNSTHPLFPSCFNTSVTYPENEGGWDIGPAADPNANWLFKATDWVPQFLHYIQNTWKPSGGIAVSEFGFAEPFEERKQLLGDIRSDLYRVSYYHDYLEAVLMAMSEGVNVVGTLAWSIFDNLEWASGFNIKFGMQYVNLTTQQRYFKASFFTYVGMFEEYQEK